MDPTDMEEDIFSRISSLTETCTLKSPLEAKTLLQIFLVNHFLMPGSLPPGVPLKIIPESSTDLLNQSIPSFQLVLWQGIVRKRQFPDAGRSVLWKMILP
jgi:hypothetical protein